MSLNQVNLKIPVPESFATVPLFLKIKKQFPEAFFFETAMTQVHTKKLTVIGVGPFEILRRRGDLTEHVCDGRTTLTTAPFFESLERLGEKIQSSSTEMFAQGGIFGCIGFDCVRELEPTVPRNANSHNQDISGEVLLARNLIIVDHALNEIRFRGDVTLEIYKIAMSVTLEPVATSIQKTGLRPEITPDRLKPSLGEKVFHEHVTTLKEHIFAGNIFQTVLAERFECVTTSTTAEIFECLTELNPAAYSFYFTFGPTDLVGASPEALLNVADRRAVTHPIAGTKPRGANEAEDQQLAESLLGSEKEGAEHLMLVDLARNDLGRVAKPGSVRVTAFRDLQKFANVMHLVSEVEAELALGVKPMQAFTACFPAGTLSGAPKIRAMQILAGLERENRGLYGGAVIAFDSAGERLESCIAIRCFEKSGDRVVLRAGAGIVADSTAESEYAEISHKLRSLRQAIAAAELLHVSRKNHPGTAFRGDVTPTTGRAQ